MTEPIGTKQYVPLMICVAGSKLYGTDTSESDTDTRGVIIPHPIYRKTVFRNMEQVELENDTVYYTLKKFFALAADCNPNIVELLFVPPSHMITNSMQWYDIRAKRNIFISKKAKHTFSGYAHSQLIKLRNHHKWIKDAPKEPTKEMFGLPKECVMSKTHAEMINKLPMEFIADEYKEFALAMKKYEAALKEFNDYNRHMRERNTKRLELERKYGYDSKHALHLVRLFIEGIELLRTGNITLPRPNAEYLRSIREGALTFDQLIEEATELESELDKAYEESELPHGPDKVAIDKLYMDICDHIDTLGTVYWS